jgi:hypothetical protein
MNRFWNQLSVRNVVASLHVRNDLTLFTPTLLQEYINHFTTLVNRSPMAMRITMDLHEYLINEKRIAIPLMPSP